MILVTGASGFVGTHLLEALVQQGLPVRALYHKRPPGIQHELIDWQSCDLLDVYAVEEVMRGVDKVFHCAAIVSFNKNDREKVIEHNRTATAHVVDESLAAGVNRFIHFSSIAALGRPTKEHNLISEETHWEESILNTAYARGKHQSEMEVWRGMAEGLNAAILNPGIILGEGDFHQGSAQLFQTAYEEFPWYTEGINAWVDVKDVVRAALLLMNNEEVQERFVLAEDNYSYKEIFTWMAEALGKRPPHRKASPFMSKVAWLLSALKAGLKGRQSVLTRETVRTAQAKNHYDNSKFLNTFPEFKYREMKDTIERVSKSFLKNI